MRIEGRRTGGFLRLVGLSICREGVSMVGVIGLGGGVRRRLIRDKWERWLKVVGTEDWVGERLEGVWVEVIDR